jgi:FkbM family methyltransferase
MDIYRFIREKIQEKSVFIEIGCHMGLDTKKFIEMTGCKNIHCFEPDERNISIMKSLNLPVILNECVVSNVDGKIEFHKSSGTPWPPTGIDILDNNDWSSSGSIKKPKLHKDILPWCKFDEVVEVKSIRMETYCSQNNINSIDFVWMDVQGAEEEVLKSFGDYINKVKYIFTEYSEDELYENCANKKNILDLLGDSWSIIHDFKTDILIKNNNYNA